MIQKKKMRLTKDFNVNHQKEEEVKFELRTLFFSPEKDCSEITVCFLISPILLIHHYSHQVCIITSAIFSPTLQSVVLSSGIRICQKAKIEGEITQILLCPK